MLPARHRMRRRVDFDAAVRRGRRGSARSVVVHVSPEPLVGPDADVPAGPRLKAGDARVTTVGFIVSRAVGGAVVRNRVRRRLRAVMARRLPELPAGSAVVVRALPAAGASTYDALERDVRKALGAALRVAA